MNSDETALGDLDTAPECVLTSELVDQSPTESVLTHIISRDRPRKDMITDCYEPTTLGRGGKNG